mmetsp:Transcript_3997/g.3283  ORF Transcript_3997/g.3283 Transcript_3997/m.3283 type:complete len:137 (+) Transcript_3997:3-413(+)
MRLAMHLSGCSSNNNNATTTAPTTSTSPTSKPAVTGQSFCGPIESPVSSTVNLTLDNNGEMSFDIPVMGDPVTGLKYEYDSDGRLQLTDVNTTTNLDKFNFKFALPDPSVTVKAMKGDSSVNFTLGWFPETTLSSC